MMISPSPSPNHDVDDRVFLIADGGIIRIEERTVPAARNPSGLMYYLLTFKDEAPTPFLVAEAIDTMGIFRKISWDFHLLADMREARLAAQLLYTPAYSKLIGVIDNPHCKHCFIFVKPIPTVLGAVLTATIKGIVSALSVPCTILETGEK